MPAELDEARRRIMQLEIEREGLRKERDEASRDRLSRLDQELEGLKQQAAALEAQWQNELQQLNDVGQLQEQIDAAAQTTASSAALWCTKRSWR